MPSSTYVGLANITLGSSAASVTFSSISQAYRDLVLVVTPITSTQTAVYVRLNADSGSNYSWVYMTGDGSSTASGSFTSTYMIMTPNDVGATDTVVGHTATYQLMDYSANDKHKTVLSRSNKASGSFAGTNAQASRWASTSAVTSIALTLGSGTFSTGSTFALYGIAA